MQLFPKLNPPPPPPPPTIETEANGNRRSIYERLFRWDHCAGTKRFFPALAGLIGPVPTLFHFICPLAQQAVVPDRLSLNMCLWMRVNPACTARAEAILIHFKLKPLNYFDTHIYRGRSVLRQVKRLSFNSSFSWAFNPATVYNLVLEKHCDLSKIKQFYHEIIFFRV